jgi:hypothetical protein
MVWSPKKLRRPSAHLADSAVNPPLFVKRVFLSHPLARMNRMDAALIDRATVLLEEANAGFEPEGLTVAQARAFLASCTRVRKLADGLIAALARRVDDAAEVSKLAGTSMGKAKETVATGKAASQSDALNSALQKGDISLDQAAEIAKAEESAPGAAVELVAIAKEEGFHVLREKARKKKLDAERHRDLAARQRAARSARSHVDDLGMVDVHLRLEPHVGTPIVARAEAEAERLAKKAKQESQEPEPFERHLADAYARLLQGSGKGRAKPAVIAARGRGYSRWPAASRVRPSAVVPPCDVGSPPRRTNARVSEIVAVSARSTAVRLASRNGAPTASSTSK